MHISLQKRFELSVLILEMLTSKNTMMNLRISHVLLHAPIVSPTVKADIVMSGGANWIHSLETVSKFVD
jgi:hypothetical protein